MQFRIIFALSRNQKKIVAVGDLLPLFMAWISRCNFCFIGTPKSDYSWRSGPSKSLSDHYHRLKGSEWDPWEYALMRSRLCKFVATRDELTARGLRKHGVKALAPGNPMMDGLGESPHPSALNNYRRVLLLCGTRVPEALENFNNLIKATELIDLREPIAFLVALGSDPKTTQIESSLLKLGYKKNLSIEVEAHAQSIWSKESKIILIGPGKFSLWAKWAELGLANSGTATEQLIGLGVPALSLPGKGPQFKKSFAQRQSRILGGAVIPCKNPKVLAERMEFLLKEKSLCKRIGRIGSRRMGRSGGSISLAMLINKFLLNNYSNNQPKYSHKPL